MQRRYLIRKVTGFEDGIPMYKVRYSFTLAGALKIKKEFEDECPSGTLKDVRIFDSITGKEVEQTEPLTVTMTEALACQYQKQLFEYRSSEEINMIKALQKSYDDRPKYDGYACKLFEALYQ